MKNRYAFLVLFLFSIQNGIAQQRPIAEMNKFCGNWQWVNGNDTFNIFLKNGIDTRVSNDITILFGCHKYIKNGIKVYDNWTNNFSNLLPINSSTMGNLDINNLNEYSGLIKDYPNNRLVELIIEYVSPTSLKMWAVSKNGIRIGGTNNNTPINLPSGITLTKL